MVVTRSCSRSALSTLLKSPSKRPHPQNDAGEVVSPRKKMARASRSTAGKLFSKIEKEQPPSWTSRSTSKKPFSKIEKKEPRSQPTSRPGEDDWTYIAGEKGEELDKFHAQCRRLKAMSHEELKNRIRTHHPEWPGK